MRIYLSHGTDLGAATLIAQQIRDRLRQQGLFHEVDLYVPAEHDDFVNTAFKAGMLTEGQILTVSCGIIEDTCDAVLIYCPKDDPISGDRKIELHFARGGDILTCQFEYIGEAVEFIKYVHKGRDK